MKKILWLALSVSLLLLCVVPPLLAQNDPTDEIRQVEQRWMAGIMSKDQKALEEILSPDLIYTHSSGVVESKAEYISSVCGGSLRYDSVTYEAPVIRIFGITGVMAAKATMVGMNKGQPFNAQMRILHVWVKEAGEWRLVAHQTTRIP
ncbi:MAG: nuclear transport factor 2 family protein [candidate division NC10 bacterium]|nr:nuclear transport factor 2 family protein [candidate division NC10 bacterium]